jgi:hypothetical protein
MHEIADTFGLSSGLSCTLYRIRRDMIPDYYLLSFPRDAGEPSPADLSEMLVLGMTRAQALAWPVNASVTRAPTACSIAATAHDVSRAGTCAAW